MTSADETAPVSKLFAVLTLITAEVQLAGIGLRELRETEKFCGSCFTGGVDSRNAEPEVSVFFYKEQMVVIVIAMHQKTVVSQIPAPAREHGKIGPLNLTYCFAGLRFLLRNRYRFR